MFDIRMIVMLFMLCNFFLLSAALKSFFDAKKIKRNMIDNHICRPLTEKEKTIAALGLTFADHRYQGGGAYRLEGYLREYKFKYRGAVTEVRYKVDGIEVIPAFDALDFIKGDVVVDVVDVGKGKMGIIKVGDEFDLESSVVRKGLQFQVEFLEGTLGTLYGSSDDSKRKEIEIISVADHDGKGVYDDRVDSEKFYFSTLHLLASFGFLLIAALVTQHSIWGLMFFLPASFFLVFSFIFYRSGFPECNEKGFRLYKVRAVMLCYGSGYSVNLGPLGMVMVPLPWRDHLVSDTLPREYDIVVSQYGGASLYSAQGLSVEKIPEPKKKWVPYAGPACASALAMMAGFFMFDISSLPTIISSFGLLQSRSIAVVFLFLLTGVVFLLSVSFYLYYYLGYRKSYHESVALARSAKARLK